MLARKRDIAPPSADYGDVAPVLGVVVGAGRQLIVGAEILAA
jgi:hypothetical protein